MVQVASYGPGTLVGELSPGGGACSATLVVGSTACELLRADRLEFFAKLSVDEDAHAHILAAFARQREAWRARRLALAACGACTVAQSARSDGGARELPRELPAKLASDIRFLPSALTFMGEDGWHRLWEKPKRLPTPGELAALTLAKAQEEEQQQQQQEERRQRQLQQQSKPKTPRRSVFLKALPPPPLPRREPPSPRSAVRLERQSKPPEALPPPKKFLDIDYVTEAPPEELRSVVQIKTQDSLFVSLRHRGGKVASNLPQYICVD